MPRLPVSASLTLARHGSDPTENDSVTGLRPNARGPGLVTFGPDRVKEFCEANGLQMIIRAHECVMDGAASSRTNAARPGERTSHTRSRRPQASSALRRAS